MTRAGRRKLGTKGAFGLASMVIAAVGVCRVAVLYLEAVSAVRADRQADLELLELCASGHARGSPKMREACPGIQMGHLKDNGKLLGVLLGDHEPCFVMDREDELSWDFELSGKPVAGCKKDCQHFSAA